MISSSEESHWHHHWIEPVYVCALNQQTSKVLMLATFWIASIIKLFQLRKHTVQILAQYFRIWPNSNSYSTLLSTIYFVIHSGKNRFQWETTQNELKYMRKKQANELTQLQQLQISALFINAFKEIIDKTLNGGTTPSFFTSMPINLQLNKLDIKNWFKLFAIVLCVCKQFNVANNAYAIDAIHMPVDLILILKKKNYFLFVPLSDSHRLRCLSYFMVWIVNESDFQLNNIQRQCDNHAISKLNSAIFNAHN